jgi:hypothetical protein
MPYPFRSSDLIRPFIASITEVKVFAKTVRGHWGVQDKIHWQLDFTFKEDQNTTKEKHGARNLQTMKRVALAILSLVKSFYDNRSLKRIRYILSLGLRSILRPYSNSLMPKPFKTSYSPDRHDFLCVYPGVLHCDIDGTVWAKPRNASF